MNYLKLVINDQVLEKYEQYYFFIHPKASKKPIENPYSPTLNSWMVMKRPMANSLKQRWKDFIIWFVDNQGYTNLHIEECDMKFSTYYKTNRRHDVDNSVPKFILDGFTESGLLVDDDSKHLKSLTLQCFVDKDYPRTEIEIENIKLEEILDGKNQKEIHQQSDEDK